MLNKLKVKLDSMRETIKAVATKKLSCWTVIWT